jgi:putative transposase
MSWVSIYVHLVFATKNREPFLNSLDLRQKVFKHIKTNTDKKEIWLDCVNGWHDHAHCLVSLGREQTIAKVAQLIKGESAHWINSNHLTENKFMWQDDYWAVGVSESQVERVRKYIHKQEIHHSNKTFNDEIKEFETKWPLAKANGS